MESNTEKGEISVNALFIILFHLLGDAKNVILHTGITFNQQKHTMPILIEKINKN